MEKDTYLWTRARSEQECSRGLKNTGVNRASKASEKAKDRAPPEVGGASGVGEGRLTNALKPQEEGVLGGGDVMS